MGFQEQSVQRTTAAFKAKDDLNEEGEECCHSNECTGRKVKWVGDEDNDEKEAGSIKNDKKAGYVHEHIKPPSLYFFLAFSLPLNLKINTDGTRWSARYDRGS